MPSEQTGNPLIQFLPAVFIFLIFYFILIKPQRDQQKKMKEQINNLKKNDSVVTAAGIHGTVVLVKEKTVVVRVDDNVKLEFDKDAITSVTKSQE